MIEQFAASHPRLWACLLFAVLVVVLAGGHVIAAVIYRAIRER